jgi:hypothetical protein
MDCVLKVVLMVIAALVNITNPFHDADDICKKHAYLEHVWSKQVREQVSIDIDFSRVLTSVGTLSKGLNTYRKVLGDEFELRKDSMDSVFNNASHLRTIAVPTLERRAYFKVKAAYANSNVASTYCQSKLDTARVLSYPISHGEVAAIKSLLKSQGIAQQPMEVEKNDFGIIDTASGHMIQFLTDVADKESVWNKGLLTYDSDSGSLGKQTLTGEQPFLCTYRVPQHLATEGAFSSFLAQTDEAFDLLDEHKVWDAKIKSFLAKADDAVASDESITFYPPAILGRAVDLVEELALAENIRDSSFNLVDAMTGLNEVLEHLLASLRFLDNESLALELSRKERKALVALMFEPKSKIGNDVLINKLKGNNYLLQFMDSRKSKVDLYRIHPLLIDGKRVYTDKYLVRTADEAFSTNEVPSLTNCVVDQSGVSTCTRPLQVRTHTQNTGCGNYIMQASIAAQQAKTSGQSSCSTSEVAVEPLNGVLNEEALYGDMPRSYVIPAVCDRRGDLATLVLTKAAEVEFNCDERILHTLHLPADNYQFSKSCGISTGGRNLFTADLGAAAHGLYNASVLTDLITKFGKKAIAALPKDDQVNYLLISVGATVASFVVAVISTAFCCQFKRIRRFVRECCSRESSMEKVETRTERVTYREPEGDIYMQRTYRDRRGASAPREGLLSLQHSQEGRLPAFAQ